MAAMNHHNRGGTISGRSIRPNSQETISIDKKWNVLKPGEEGRDIPRGAGRFSGGKVDLNYSFSKKMRQERCSGNKWVRNTYTDKPLSIDESESKLEVSTSQSSALEPCLNRHNSDSLSDRGTNKCSRREEVNAEFNGVLKTTRMASVGNGKLVLRRDDIQKDSGMNLSREGIPCGKSSFTWSLQTAGHPTKTTWDLDRKMIPGDVINAELARKRKRMNSNRINDTSDYPRRIPLDTTLPQIDSTPNFLNAEYERRINPDEKSVKANLSDMTVTTSKKLLTDYCYRETGRQAGSSSGRGHNGQSIRSSRGVHMGLVRVKSVNPTGIAICPTFRQGIPCTNQGCTLRHDISTEASRPICVFFQKNGMCSKGDTCPFRHIKVRADSSICPHFETLGYCEDPDCVLRHVVIKPSTRGSVDYSKRIRSKLL